MVRLAALMFASLCKGLLGLKAQFNATCRCSLQCGSLDNVLRQGGNVRWLGYSQMIPGSQSLAAVFSQVSFISKRTIRFLGSAARQAQVWTTIRLRASR